MWTTSLAVRFGGPTACGCLAATVRLHFAMELQLHTHVFPDQAGSTRTAASASMQGLQSYACRISKYHHDLTSQNLAHWL